MLLNWARLRYARVWIRSAWNSKLLYKNNCLYNKNAEQLTVCKVTVIKPQKCYEQTFSKYFLLLLSHFLDNLLTAAFQPLSALYPVVPSDFIWGCSLDYLHSRADATYFYLEYKGFWHLESKNLQLTRALKEYDSPWNLWHMNLIQVQIQWLSTCAMGWMAFCSTWPFCCPACFKSRAIDITVQSKIK